MFRSPSGRALGIAASLVLAASCASAPVASAPVAPACPEPVALPAAGTYCGVDVSITPWAAADAEWEGAQFQSDEGHGQSRDITITFSVPVASVEVTAYDPTFAGNRLEAYDAAGRLLGSAEFPGNETPGELTRQTRTIAGAISSVKLVAAKRDYLNYSMRVQYRPRRSR